MKDPILDRDEQNTAEDRRGDQDVAEPHGEGPAKRIGCGATLVGVEILFRPLHDIK